MGFIIIVIYLENRVLEKRCRTQYAHNVQVSIVEFQAESCVQHLKSFQFLFAFNTTHSHLPFFPFCQPEMNTEQGTTLNSNENTKRK